jgi:hypothetical protein
MPNMSLDVPPNKLSALQTLYNTFVTRTSDINEHLPTLLRYATQCSSVVEFGVRGGASTSALLLGLMTDGTTPKKYIGVDISDCPITQTFSDACKDTCIEYTFIKHDSATVDIPTVDLLFIDSWHIYGHLKRELARNVSRVNKFIILHDTTVDEWAGESIRNGWNIAQQSKDTGYPQHEICAGLWPAVHEFLHTYADEWELCERFTNNNGLTILRNKTCTPLPTVLAPPSVATYSILANNRYWIPIAHALQEALQANGMYTEVVSSVTNPSCTYIVFCAHEMCTLPPKYIAYNFEQLFTNNALQTNEVFWKRIREAEQVWDYSLVNLPLYAAKQIKATFLPYGFAKCMLPSSPSSNTRDVNGTFIGALNDRRNQLLKPVIEYDSEFQIHTSTFGENLRSLCNRTNVSVNLHYYSGHTVLEVVRIWHLLAHGVMVITERSADKWYDHLCAPVVEFVNDPSVELLPTYTRIRTMYIDEEYATQERQRILDYLQTECSYATFVKRARLLL